MIWCIILITLILMILCSGKTIEGFSSSKTDIIYSNRTIADNKDKYANINQEILVITQDPGKNRITEFNYFRGPLNSYMALYSRMLNPKGELVTINTTLVQITEVNYDILQLFGLNRALINDNFNGIKYYIKVLDKKSYEDELKKARTKRINLNNYNQCVNLQRLTNPTNISIANCRSKFQLD